MDLTSNVIYYQCVSPIGISCGVKVYSKNPWIPLGSFSKHTCFLQSFFLSLVLMFSPSATLRLQTNENKRQCIVTITIVFKYTMYCSWASKIDCGCDSHKAPYLSFPLVIINHKNSTSRKLEWRTNYIDECMMLIHSMKSGLKESTGVVSKL